MLASNISSVQGSADSDSTHELEGRNLQTIEERNRRAPTTTIEERSNAPTTTIEERNINAPNTQVRHEESALDSREGLSDHPRTNSNVRYSNGGQGSNANSFNNTRNDISIITSASQRSRVSNETMLNASALAIGAVTLGVCEISGITSIASLENSPYLVGTAAFIGTLPGYFASLLARMKVSTEEAVDMAESKEGVQAILEMIGLQKAEAVALAEGLQVDKVSMLVAVHHNRLRDKMKAINIDEDRLDQLTFGLEVFKDHYFKQDTQELHEDGSMTVDNTFKTTSYSAPIHRYLVQQKGASSAINPSFTREVAKIALDVGGNPEPENDASASAKLIRELLIAGQTKIATADAGDSGEGSKESNSESSKEGKELKENYQVKFEIRNEKKNSEEISKEKDGGHDEDDGGSETSNSSSDSDSDSEDDEEYPYMSSRGSKYMDPSKNPIPSIPANQKDLKLYFLKLETEVDSINGSRLIEHNNQLDKPIWKRTRKRGQKYKQYKRKVKVWEELNRSILHYIRGTALVNGHPLKAELGRLKSGVEAFDLVRTTLNPVQYNEVSSSQEALDNFMSLKLHSVQKGSFENFKIQLEERIEDMAANNMALAQDENTPKLSLFSKLPHESYRHIFLNMNQFEGLDYKSTLNKLSAAAALIESAETMSQGHEHRNINHAGTTDDKPSIPGTIGGFKVNKKGRINNDAWRRMSFDERAKYYNAKDKLRKSGVIFLEDKQFDSTAEEEEEETEEKAKEESTSDNANINTMTFAEVLERMPEETATKTLNYVTSKLIQPG
jgi:hypothetical protein